MQVNNVNFLNYSDNNSVKKLNSSPIKPQEPIADSALSLNKIDAQCYRANSVPINFSGNASKINNACIITNQEDVPLYPTVNNNSYIVEFDTQSEIIYGEDAINYLQNTSKFNYDTQIIFPKKASGSLLVGDKNIDLKENSAILLNAGAEAKVNVENGYPMILISKRDLSWYDRYKKESSNETIQDKFNELTHFNSHLYNGEFSLDVILPESVLNDENVFKTTGVNKWESRNNLINELYKKRDLLDSETKEKIKTAKVLQEKLYESNLITDCDEGYVKFALKYNDDYFKKVLVAHSFTDDEIEKLMPINTRTYSVSLDSKLVKKDSSDLYSDKIIEKMKQRGFFHENKNEKSKWVYWTKCYGDEQTLSDALKQSKFTPAERAQIIAGWKEGNKIGYDLSGLKFINDSCAVYNLDDKLNNWTQEKSNWVSNSTAPSCDKGKTPSTGVSMVQMDEEKIARMSELRRGEKLHSHPNLDEKRQTEVYLITSGSAALNLYKPSTEVDDEDEQQTDEGVTVKILKEGDLAIVDPGVAHCINSVKGEYEHICAQIPSAFQYGFGFKQIVKPPKDYDEETLAKEAFNKLSAV